MEDSLWFSRYSTFEEDRGVSPAPLAGARDPRFADDSIPAYSRSLQIPPLPGLGDFQISDWGEDRWPAGRSAQIRHRDNTGALCFIVNGKGTLNDTPVERGTALFPDPHRPCVLSSDREDPLCFCWIRLRGDQTFLTRLNLFSFEEDGCGRFDFSSCLQDVLRLHRKGQRLEGSGLYLALSLNSLFFEILSRCLRTATKRPPQTPYVTRALAYIRAHYAEAINVNLLAQELHISRVHLRRLFLQELGVLPKDQIVKCRMEAAVMRLQQESPPPLAQIATEVGYPSYSQFIRAFRKAYGCSPKEYRETLE